MHVQEKQAWFVLIVATVTLGLWLVVVAVFGYHEATFGIFGLGGFSGFAPLIGHRERKAGMVIMDERDKQIAQSAQRLAFCVFWGVFMLMAMGPFVILGPFATLTLRTTTICFIVFPAMMVVFLAQSLIVVVLYRRGCRG